MAPGPEHPPASLQQEQNKSTRTCRRPAPSAPPNPGPGRGPGAVGTRAERRRGAGASAASFLQPRPRRPQPRLQRRRRRPRGMACLMAAFSVGTAMVSRTSFATRGWLLSSMEAGNPKPGWLVLTPAACERILRALTWGALERCPALPASALATWSLGMLLLRAPGRWRDPEWVASSPTSGQVDGLDLSASWVRGWGCGSALGRDCRLSPREGRVGSPRRALRGRQAAGDFLRHPLERWAQWWWWWWGGYKKRNCVPRNGACSPGLPRDSYSWRRQRSPRRDRGGRAQIPARARAGCGHLHAPQPPRDQSLDKTWVLLNC